MASILVVDDEPGIRERPYALVILDLRMPGPRGGMDVLRDARAEWPAMQVVVSTAHFLAELRRRRSVR